jgi:hypothetical protein
MVDEARKGVVVIPNIRVWKIYGAIIAGREKHW